MTLIQILLSWGVPLLYGGLIMAVGLDLSRFPKKTSEADGQ